jgi:hypothetical protein
VKVLLSTVTELIYASEDLAIKSEYVLVEYRLCITGVDGSTFLG